MDDFALCINYTSYSLVRKPSSEQYVYREVFDFPNQMCKRTSSMKISNCMGSSIFNTSLFVVRNCSNFIYLMNSSQRCGINPLLIRFGPSPVSSKLATVSQALDNTPTESSTRYVGLPENDAALCRPSSIWTFKNLPSGRSCMSKIGSALASRLRFFGICCNKCSAFPMHMGTAWWPALRHVRDDCFGLTVRRSGGYRPPVLSN